jgi:hypothetical protein
MTLDPLTFEVIQPNEVHRCVVRLVTSYWHNRSGVHIKRSLTYLKRQCKGYNILDEDVSNCDAETVLSHIVNINECEDGVYQVVTCNESHDWEMPHIIDDYDYKLIPHDEKQ